MSVQVKTGGFAIGIWRGAYLIVWSIGALLCVWLALFSYRYLVGFGGAPPVIAGNALKNPWLLVHVAGAATALLAGTSAVLVSIESSFSLASPFDRPHLCCLVPCWRSSRLCVGAGRLNWSNFNGRVWKPRHYVDRDDVARMAPRDEEPLH